MKKEITWTLKTGKEAKVEIALILEETINADGDKITVKCCMMEIMASVEGMGIIGSGRPQKAQTAAARIGKLGITQDNLDRINTAIAEIEATPEWQAKIEGEKIAARESEEYEIHHNAVKKMMAE